MLIYDTAIVTSRLFRESFNCSYNPRMDYAFSIGKPHGESASLPQYLGCNTVFDMRLRVTFLRRKTVSLQSNIAYRE